MEQKEPRIASARITPMPRPMPLGMGDPMPAVMVKFEGSDTEVKLFEYYPDELHFHAGEFIGLTGSQARELKLNKDKRYLQS